jgi:hypothetical protein
MWCSFDLRGSWDPALMPGDRLPDSYAPNGSGSVGGQKPKGLLSFRCLRDAGYFAH